METPMLTKLKEVLSNMSREEFLERWSAIEQLGIEGITAKELILSFDMPSSQESTISNFTAQVARNEYFNTTTGSNTFAMAA